MLEKLFRFPVVMIDGNREAEKERESQLLALDNKEPVDVIYGEAECPYYDFISISDRWLPTEKSYNRALDGKFDACSVLFLHSGNYVVPWPKEKFKGELKRFAESVISEDPKGKNIISMSKEDFFKALNNGD